MKQNDTRASFAHTSSQNNTPQEILQKIKEANNILVLMDSRFDFDNLGCALVMSYILKSLGKSFDVTYEKQFPKKASQLFEVSHIRQDVDPRTIDYSNYDLMIIMDCGQLSHMTKLGDFIPPKNITKINIDHHKTNEYYGDLNYVEENKSSACNVMHELVTQWGIELDNHASKALVMGILSDTGILQYDNVHSEDFRIIADYMDKGVDVFDLIWNYSFNLSYPLIRYKGLACSNLKLNLNKKYAYSFAHRKDLEEIGSLEELEAISASDFIKQVENVDFVVFIKQTEVLTQWKLSFRNHNPSYDVTKIASMFKGGGHKAAAGGQIDYAETLEDVVNKIEEAINTLKN